MNNELEIRILTGDVLGTTEQTQEAITMAVRALSQPDVHDTNVGDLISRAEALDEMQKAGTRDGAEWAVRILPPAQPEPRWIPVESEPPEFGKEVLISHKGAVSIDWLTQSEGWAYFFVSGVAIADIDAWMPLPESYRGGENG